MMTIGEFALHSGLSVKALRFYDERALLPATHIDPQSGYRHYRTDQLRDAVTIRVLRAAGMPLDLVGQALAEPDRLDALLDEHRRALAARRDLEDRGLALTARLGDWQHGADVAVRDAEPVYWAGARRTLDVSDDVTDDADDWGNTTLEALGQALFAAGHRPLPLWWTTMRQGPSPAQVDVLMCFATAEPVGAEVALPGEQIETGRLPRRREAWVRRTFAQLEGDLLDDTPGGRLPDPAVIALLAYAESAGQDDPWELRQIGVPDASGQPVGMDLAFTLPDA